MALKCLQFSPFCQDIAYLFQCHSWTTCFLQHLCRGLDRTLLLVPLLGDGRFWSRTVWEISWTLSLVEKKNRWCVCSMKQNGTSPWHTNHQLYFQPVGILTGLHFSQVWVGEHFKRRTFNTEKKLWLLFSEVSESSLAQPAHTNEVLGVPIPGTVPVFPQMYPGALVIRVVQ